MLTGQQPHEAPISSPQTPTDPANIVINQSRPSGHAAPAAQAPLVQGPGRGAAQETCAHRHSPDVDHSARSNALPSSGKAGPSVDITSDALPAAFSVPAVAASDISGAKRRRASPTSPSAGVSPQLTTASRHQSDSTALRGDGGSATGDMPSTQTAPSAGAQPAVPKSGLSHLAATSSGAKGMARSLMGHPEMYAVASIDQPHSTPVLGPAVHAPGGQDQGRLLITGLLPPAQVRAQQQTAQGQQPTGARHPQLAAIPQAAAPPHQHRRQPPSHQQAAAPPQAAQPLAAAHPQPGMHHVPSQPHPQHQLQPDLHFLQQQVRLLTQQHLAQLQTAHLQQLSAPLPTQLPGLALQQWSLLQAPPLHLVHPQAQLHAPHMQPLQHLQLHQPPQAVEAEIALGGHPRAPVGGQPRHRLESASQDQVGRPEGATPASSLVSAQAGQVALMLQRLPRPPAVPSHVQASHVPAILAPGAGDSGYHFLHPAQHVPHLLPPQQQVAQAGALHGLPQPRPAPQPSRPEAPQPAPPQTQRMPPPQPAPASSRQSQGGTPPLPAQAPGGSPQHTPQHTPQSAAAPPGALLHLAPPGILSRIPCAPAASSPVPATSHPPPQPATASWPAAPAGSSQHRASAPVDASPPSQQSAPPAPRPACAPAWPAAPMSPVDTLMAHFQGPGMRALEALDIPRPTTTSEVAMLQQLQRNLDAVQTRLSQEQDSTVAHLEGLVQQLLAGGVGTVRAKADGSRFIADAHRALLTSTRIAQNLQGPEAPPAVTDPAAGVDRGAEGPEAVVMQQIREAARAAAAAADPQAALAALAVPPPPPPVRRPAAAAATATAPTTAPDDSGAATAPSAVMAGAAPPPPPLPLAVLCGSNTLEPANEQESAAQLQGADDGRPVPQSTGTSIAQRRQPGDTSSQNPPLTAAVPCPTGGTDGTGGTAGTASLGRTGESDSAATSNRPNGTTSAGVSVQLAASLLLDGGGSVPVAAASALGQPPTSDAPLVSLPPHKGPDPDSAGQPDAAAGGLQQCRSSAMSMKPPPAGVSDVAGGSSGQGSAPGSLPVASAADTGSLAPIDASSGYAAVAPPTAAPPAEDASMHEEATPAEGMHGSSGQEVAAGGGSAHGSHVPQAPVEGADGAGTESGGSQLQGTLAASAAEGGGSGCGTSMGEASAVGAHAATGSSRATAEADPGPPPSSEGADAGSTVRVATVGMAQSGREPGNCQTDGCDAHEAIDPRR
eukprot:jgi/Ulvmu1/1102/UM106_0019.1